MRIPAKYLFAFLAFLLTFGCFYAVNSWHQQRLVEEPLSKALLQVKGVKAVQLIKDRKSAEVQITLDGVENLPQTYSDIEDLLISIYGEDAYEISLINSSDPYLESVYHKIHFALLEGERLGNYSTMNEEVLKQLSGEAGLKNYRLWVDQSRIYLLLTNSRNTFYEVIPIVGEGA